MREPWFSHSLRHTAETCRDNVHLNPRLVQTQEDASLHRLHAQLSIQTPQFAQLLRVAGSCAKDQIGGCKYTDVSR